jgi:hypothetical protein
MLAPKEWRMFTQNCTKCLKKCFDSNIYAVEDSPQLVLVQNIPFGHFSISNRPECNYFNDITSKIINEIQWSFLRKNK